MKCKKYLAMMLAVVMAAGTVAGCGSSAETATADSQETADSVAAGTESAQESAAEASEAGSESAEEGRKVVVYKNKTDAEDASKQAVDAAFTEETGIEVEVRTLAGEAGDEFQKSLDIALMNGDDGDVIFIGNNKTMCKYAESGLLLPLNDLISQYGDDVDAKYGTYITDAINSDGEITGLPSESNTWAVYYNKKIFDDAGVPYPEGPWTWSEYIETAQKLTDAENGIYGSYMLTYDNYFFGYASQLGVSAYKEDGTSNYDAPEFAEALKFYNDLGAEYKIQPSYLEFTTKKLPWDGFMSGQYGMFYISSWFLETLANTSDYPRDWEFGIVQSPTPDGADVARNMASTGFYGVVENGQNHEEAYEYVRYMADEAYKLSGRIPARIDITDEGWEQVFADTIEKSGNNVTLEEVTGALVNNGMEVVSEKIVGSIPAEYSDIIKKNAELYMLGEQSLETAVSEIKSQADEAIAQALKDAE